MIDKELLSVVLGEEVYNCDTELEAIIKACEYIASEKGLLCKNKEIR